MGRISIAGIVFSIIGVAAVVFAIIMDKSDSSKDREEPKGYDAGYEDGWDACYFENYESAYEDGFYDGYNEGRYEYEYDPVEAGIFFETNAHYYVTDNSEWSPEEACMVIEAYRGNEPFWSDGSPPSEEEYNEAVDSLMLFYDYFFSRLYNR